MDLDELLQRALPHDPPTEANVQEPSPFVAPSLQFREESSGAPVLLVEAPAAVGKSTFAQWLASNARGHLIDLSQANVGGHGFRGELSAADLLDDFRAGRVTVVVDAVDEGLIRSGVSNFLAYLEDVAGVIGEAAPSWDAECLRIVLLGRAEATSLVAIALEDAHLGFDKAELLYLDQHRSRSLVLKMSGRPEDDQVANEAIDAFFRAAAEALGVPLDQLWETPVGRGFVGYPPVLALVAKEVADNPAAARSDWDTQGEWESAWQLLMSTAQGLLRRERGKVVGNLPFTVNDAAYAPAQQLALLSDRLKGSTPDPTEGISFDSATEAQEFREAALSHLDDHPFLAPGASDVFGSMVAAQSIAAGHSMRGAERALSNYARLPFLWRFFAAEDASSRELLVEGEGLGWVLASLWNGSAEVGWTRIVERDGGLHLDMADGEPIDALIGTDLVLRGIARQLHIAAPSAPIRLATRKSAEADSSVFVLRGGVELSIGELSADGIDLLVEYDSFVTIRSRQSSPTIPSSLRVQPGSRMKVSDELYTYPWTQGERLPDLDDGSVPAQLNEFLERVVGTLPEGGRPAVLTRGGTPKEDDPNFRNWNREERQSLATLLRELQAAEVVKREPQVVAGSTPMFQYRPQGFVWKDLLDSEKRAEEPLAAMDWRSLWESLM